MNNKPHSEKTKRLLSSLKKGIKLSEEHRLKVIKTLHNGSGQNNPHWKGGKTEAGGYILVRMPEHPKARSNGYYPEHRLVMEKKIGRVLKREEQVHHLNQVKTDNRPENLVLVSAIEHGHIHWSSPEARIKKSLVTKEARAKRFWSTRKLSAN